MALISSYHFKAPSSNPWEHYAVKHQRHLVAQYWKYTEGNGRWWYPVAQQSFKQSVDLKFVQVSVDGADPNNNW